MKQQRLWAPWRMAYISKLDDDADASKSKTGCFLCDAAEAGLTDQRMTDLLILKRDDRGILMLNRYPYTNGHLLVAPFEHVGDISDMTSAQRAGMMDLCDLGARLLRKTMNTQGVNIGMNLGRCAGAGLPGHVHMHVVPRWNGDVNFMHTIGMVRVIPQALDESYNLLKDALNDVR